jgi:hypothetical protein
MLGQVSHQDLHLCIRQTDVAHELDHPQVAKQLKSRMLVDAYNMHMGWAMVVGINNHAPALVSQYCRHVQYIPSMVRLIKDASNHPAIIKTLRFKKQRKAHTLV